MKSPISLKKILQTAQPDTQRLLRQAGHLMALNQRLAHQLPDPLAQHCQIAALERRTLTIVVSSPAWATRLRLQQHRLIKAFQDIAIQNLSIQISPEAGISAQTIQKQPRTMSQQTYNLLINLAETTADPKLRQALRRLSQHARNKSK